jgi:hypothetical protein
MATAIDVSAVRHQASSVRSAASRVRRIASHPSLGTFESFVSTSTRFTIKHMPRINRELVSLAVLVLNRN